MSRIKFAEPGGSKDTERSLVFWLLYNWDTTEKKIFLVDDPELKKVQEDGEWNRLYRCEVILPVPAAEDLRTEIQRSSDVLYDESDRFNDKEPILTQVAHRLFLRQLRCLPWKSITTKVECQRLTDESYTVSFNGKSFMISVAEVDSLVR